MLCVVESSGILAPANGDVRVGTCVSMSKRLYHSDIDIVDDGRILRY